MFADVYTLYTKGAVITGNTLNNNSYGILIQGGGEASNLNSNIFSGEKDASIAVRHGGIVYDMSGNILTHDCPYGIYVDDENVIQYGKYDDMLKKDAKEIEVLITNISDFAGGKFIEVRNYSLKERIFKRRPSKIVRKAMLRLGEKEYNIINNNCEHFVNDCAFYRHK